MVRDVPQMLLKKLKYRAAVHGVSAEEEHCRILRDALPTKGAGNPLLIEFLLTVEVSRKVELALKRWREVESRETGF